MQAHDVHHFLMFVNFTHLASSGRDEAEADAMAATIWAGTWPVQRVRQREFFDFGMEVRVGVSRGVGGGEGMRVASGSSSTLALMCE